MADWRTVEGALLSAAEREWLVTAAVRAAIRFPHPVMVNIGVYKGASMYCLRAGAPNVGELVGIDLTPRTLPDLRAEFVWGDSRRVAWERDIHLLFIDGGHDYDTVRSDIARFGSHVVPDGIMAFHDYGRSDAYLAERARRYPNRAPLGVKRAADELCTPERGWQFWAAMDSIKAFRRVAHG